jgi:dimethylaniline monooxygenase (N-oxide forming)
MPPVDGIEHVPEILHSSEVKARSQFLGDGSKPKSVMILGAGETGHDMAHLAVTAAASPVVLCHRDGFFCGPKAFNSAIGPPLAGVH